MKQKDDQHDAEDESDDEDFLRSVFKPASEKDIEEFKAQRAEDLKKKVQEEPVAW